MRPSLRRSTDARIRPRSRRASELSPRSESHWTKVPICKHARIQQTYMQTKETTTMKTTTTIAAVGITLLAAAMSAAIAADTAQPAAAGQPNADAILKAMSDKLGNAQHFSFKATREIAAALAEAHVLPAKCDIEVTVQRPNNVFGTSTSKDGERRLYFNGKDLTMFDGKNNMYSTVPPLAEFVRSNPYKDMKFRAKTIADAGTEMAGNPPADCQHLKLAGKLAD